MLVYLSFVGFFSLGFVLVGFLFVVKLLLA